MPRRPVTFPCIMVLAAAILFPAPALPQGIITTIAGTDWLFPGDGRPAVDAPIGGAFLLGIAVDKQGNYYIADRDNIMVFKVTPDGILTVIAGNGILGYSGDGGPATSASLFEPEAVAVDTAGNVYIADGDRIRKVNLEGIISTLAGNDDRGYGGDGGPAADAVFDSPYSIAVDGAGNLFIADEGNNRIRKITPNGIITTVAGNGQAGFSGDGGPATSAMLNGPFGVAVDNGGNIYIADTSNGRIRKVSPQGVIATVAGGGAPLIDDGIPAVNGVLIPIGVAVDAAGNFYLSDFLTQRVRKVTNGIITTIAGNFDLDQGFSGDGGPALQAQLNSPTGVAVDADGNVYIGDSGNIRVRQVGADGVINTVAGNGEFRFSGEGGPATSGTLYQPASIAYDNSGNLYIAEPGRNRVRKVAANGIITTLAGTGAPGGSGDDGPASSAQLYYPSGVAADRDGNVYISDQINNRIRRVAPDGVISTIAGTGTFGFSGDGGPATQAELDGPQAVAVDAAGNIYIADYYNQRVRKVTPAGVISTYAGSGRQGFSGDGGPATSAALNGIEGLTLDAQGNLYLADSLNSRIRKVTPQGVISTIAGNGQRDFSGDGGPALNAALNVPTGVLVDTAGNVYIADERNVRVREVTPNGIINTIAGGGSAANGRFSGDGGPATNAVIAGPSAVTFDRAGNLIVADFLNHRIRAILSIAPAYQSAPDALTFSGESGGVAAPAQTVQLASSIPGVVFQTAVSGGADWLAATPSLGRMPAGAQVTADPGGLAPGTYRATLTFTAPDASPSVHTTAVAFTVTPARAAKLAANPDRVSFVLAQGAPAATQTITVSNEGGGSLDFSASVAIVSGGAWLRVSADSGTSTPANSTPLNVVADPKGLAPGTYSGLVTVSSSTTGESVAIAATMTVSAVQQIIRLQQSGLTFTAVEGGDVTPAQSFGVQNIGQGVMSWSVSTSVLSGDSNWLAASPAGGSSNASLPDAPSVEVSVDPTGLPAGDYYGQVSVSAQGAVNSPQTISIVLNVLPAGSNPGPIVQPAGLVFTGVAGGVSPGSQVVSVANLTGSAVTFTSGRSTRDGGPWFVHIPSDVTLPPQEFTRIVVQPVLGGLQPGVYRGALTLQFGGGVTRSVSLLFVVAPGTSSAAKSARRADGACTPTELAPLITSLSDSFATPAGWPAPVSVRVVDDCGSPMISGSVVATFSNGDPALVLTHARSENWSGTWQPRATASQLTVTVRAEIPELRIKGTTQVSGGLRTNQKLPVITPGGIISAASLTPQSGVAPGSLVSILGTGLADAALSATDTPLPPSLGGTSVIIAGRLAPLLSVSDGRIDAIVPYDVPPNTSLQLFVQKGSVPTLPEPVNTAPAQPAIFTKDKSGIGQGLVYAASEVMADSSNPVRAGDTILIQCAGLGAVNPPVAAGAPAPGSPRSSTITSVSVNIGGVNAPVSFAGLAPGTTGVYQVQATVPSGVAAGDAVPVVLSAGGQISPAVTMAVR